jgi:NitT/TauT family transport system substrate-binding protein
LPGKSAFVRARLLVGLAILVVLPALLVACGDEDDGGSDEPQQVTVGLTFVPNIQFAPFYVADALGYYEDAGLEVEFNHPPGPPVPKTRKRTKTPSGSLVSS